jgi:hypothetical protein
MEARHYLHAPQGTAARLDMAQIDERILTVNRHGAVAVPGVFWLAMAFLVRYWIVVLVVFASSKRSPEASRLLGTDFPWIMLILEFPALLVVGAAWQRKPNAAAIWRVVWKNGRTILIMVAALDVLAASAALWTTDVWRRWPELFIGSTALIAGAIIYALTRDDFFRQLFADFPAAVPARQP